MIVNHILWLPFARARFKVDFSFFALYFLNLSHLFLFQIGNYFLPVVLADWITAIDIFFQTIEEPTFPNVDYFVGPSWNEIVSLLAKLSNVWVRLQRVLQPTFLGIPYLGSPVLRRANEIRTVRVEVNGFDRAFMPLIDLYHVLGAEVIYFYLFIVRAWRDAVA